MFCFCLVVAFNIALDSTCQYCYSLAKGAKALSAQTPFFIYNYYLYFVIICGTVGTVPVTKNIMYR